MKKLILITAVLVGSLVQAETYVCNQPQDQGGKTIAIISLLSPSHNIAIIKYDIDDQNPGKYKVAYGQYSKSESECPSRLCGNFIVEFHAEVFTSKPTPVGMIQGQISQQNGRQFGDISFYYHGAQTPSTFQCSLIEN